MGFGQYRKGTLFYGHIPRLTFLESDENINIEEPEISQAYYDIPGKRNYIVESDKRFNLYFDVSIPVITVCEETPIPKITIKVNGIETGIEDRKCFYEEYGGDTYYILYKYNQVVDEGKYEIEIESDGKYVLAIGKEEVIKIGESLNSIYSLLIIKTLFFEKTIFSMFVGKIGRLLIFIGLILLLLFLFITVPATIVILK